MLNGKTKENDLNIRDKNIKASAARNKEDYIQAANNKFGFKVEGEGTYIWTSETAEAIATVWKPESSFKLSDRCVKKEVTSYEMKVVGNNHYWVVTELDGTILVINEIEYTKNYFNGKRNKKAKETDYIAPHKCFGYFKSIDDAAWVARDVEECPEKDSYFYWRKNLVSLIEDTFKGE